jgi:hypothetical protein
MVDEAKEYAEVLDLVERGFRSDRLDQCSVPPDNVSLGLHAILKGITYIDEAISINPNYADGFMQSGLVRIRLSETRIAIDHLNRAPAIFHGLALAHHADGDPVTACDWARRSVRHNPKYLAGWIAFASSAAFGRQGG